MILLLVCTWQQPLLLQPGMKVVQNFFQTRGFVYLNLRSSSTNRR